MYHNAAHAYENVNRSTISGRETEARVLTQAALKLIKVQQNWEDAHRNELLDDALSYNQRLWSLLQTELAQPDNPLPEKVRFDILRLSKFIDKRIYETIAFPTPEKLDIIIKINQNLAAGLRGSAA